MSDSIEITDFLIGDEEPKTEQEAIAAQEAPAVQSEDSPLPEVEDTPDEPIEPTPDDAFCCEEEAPAPEEVAPSTTLEAGIAAILKQLGALSDDFAHKLRYDANKQAIIDRQHEELERYRQDTAFKLSKALIMDIISEVDSAEKSSKFYETLECTPENYAKLKKLVLGISDDLRDLLERNDIYSYRSEAGTPFNVKRQRVLKTIPTGEEALAKTIQESVRWGFEAVDKVIRHELVNVYAYDPSLAAQTEARATEEPACEPEPAPEA